MPNTTPSQYTTFTPWISSTPENINLFDCAGFCKNDGMCTLTGPGMTPMCSCGSNFKGQRCEETVLWFQFFVRDNKLTGTGYAALFCIGVSLAILTFTGVIIYRRYKHRKSKAREKETFQQSVSRPHFDELASRQELLVYQVAQPAPRRPSPRLPSATPLSPREHHAMPRSRDYYVTPTSPPPSVPPPPSEPVAWQDFHNPGYRQSYIDTII